MSQRAVAYIQRMAEVLDPKTALYAVALALAALMDEATGEAHVTMAAIEAQAQKGRTCVRDNIRRLEQMGIVCTEPQLTGNGFKRTGARYRFPDLEAPDVGGTDESKRIHYMSATIRRRAQLTRRQAQIRALTRLVHGMDPENVEQVLLYLKDHSATPRTG